MSKYENFKESSKDSFRFAKERFNDMYGRLGAFSQMDLRYQTQVIADTINPETMLTQMRHDYDNMGDNIDDYKGKIKKSFEEATDGKIITRNSIGELTGNDVSELALDPPESPNNTGNRLIQQQLDKTTLYTLAKKIAIPKSFIGLVGKVVGGIATPLGMLMADELGTGSDKFDMPNGPMSDIERDMLGAAPFTKFKQSTRDKVLALKVMMSAKESRGEAIDEVDIAVGVKLNGELFREQLKALKVKKEIDEDL